MRNRAGITKRSPTGTDEVVYSNVTKTKKREGMWFRTRLVWPGDMFAFRPGMSGIKRDSTEQKFQ